MQMLFINLLDVLQYILAGFAIKFIKDNRLEISMYDIVCACPYFSNIGLSAMTLYYPVQDKTTTRPVNTQNYYKKIKQAENHFYLKKQYEFFIAIMSLK